MNGFTKPAEESD
jgi:hypothetical protein